MKKRSFSHKSDSLFVILLNSKWQYSAILAVAIFSFAYIVFMFLGSRNVIVQSIISIFNLLVGMFILILVAIAFFNYFRQSKSSSNPSNQANQRNLDNEKSKPSVGNDWSNIDSKLIAKQLAYSWSIELLQSIEWKLFEDLSAAYYREKGIRTELTKLGADGGIDIKLFGVDSEKPTHLIQCKAWNTKQVGVKPIRELLGVMVGEKAKGIFMVTGTYTQEAIAFAKENGINLIDGKTFILMINSLPADAQQRLLKNATEGDYTTPSCPSCGIKMSRRSGKNGSFWGCSNYPRCHQILHIKGG